jgi:hypothetical protein
VIKCRGLAVKVDDILFRRWQQKYNARYEIILAIAIICLILLTQLVGTTTSVFFQKPESRDIE